MRARVTVRDDGQLLYTEERADRNKTVEATCWMLLKRYGIVFRDLLARETNLPKWRELQVAYRRLEDRGEIRGGRFIDGFLGEQFALPVAVESVRAMRKQPLSGEIITVQPPTPWTWLGSRSRRARPSLEGQLILRDGVAVTWKPWKLRTMQKILQPRFPPTAITLKINREPDEGGPQVPE